MAPVPILGYRTLRVVNGRFLSLSFDYVWHRGINVAGCTYRKSHLAVLHKSPYKRCMCGLYACHTLEQTIAWTAMDMVMSDTVVVQVSGSGKVLVETDLYRSQYMEVVGIMSWLLPVRRSQLASEYFGVPQLL